MIDLGLFAKNRYPKFLVAKLHLKKDLEIYFFCILKKDIAILGKIL